MPDGRGEAAAAQLGKAQHPGAAADAAAARAPVSCRGTSIPTPARLAPSRGAWSARPLGGAPCLHDRTRPRSPPAGAASRFGAAMLLLTPTCCQPVDCPLVRAIRLPHGRILHLCIAQRRRPSKGRGGAARRCASASLSSGAVSRLSDGEFALRGSVPSDAAAFGRRRRTASAHGQ